MAEETKNPTPPADRGTPKGPKLFKFRAKEPLGELVRGEMVCVPKGGIIELSKERAEAISFLVEPVE